MTATFPFAKAGVFYLANGMGPYMRWARWFRSCQPVHALPARTVSMNGPCLTPLLDMPSVQRWGSRPVHPVPEAVGKRSALVPTLQRGNAILSAPADRAPLWLVLVLLAYRR